ncbi:MAG: UDP-N-acetylglucosamine 1-carboxyvinyltransferase [Alphaproteobacteria bacterium]|nr:MAG: UDP-N-acetylglucosamine 1-carboxyvinyltransferase [Alphaproteobacteria bacterium]
MSDALVIRGGRPLQGTLPISGAKNAALPQMAAALLSDKPLTLLNLPHLSDVATMATLLAEHGVELELAQEGGASHLTLTAARVRSTVASYDLVRRMRASILVLGPLLARTGSAKVAMPGGCTIGARPIDLHLKGLRQLGATVELRDGFIDASAPHGLTGARIVLPIVSVGATETLMMAASLARGQTLLINAAREPEVQDLARCLVAMGAEISGIGTDTLVITGKPRLGAARHRVIVDRVEAGTYAIAAAITGGRLHLTGARRDDLPAFLQVLEDVGVEVGEDSDGILVGASNRRLTGVDLMTEPFPGFPTDLQAQMMALMAVADGASMITETIFENRFMHVPELCRLGANITVHNASAHVRGVMGLSGAPVMATDLRASAGLVVAGLAASGETIIHGADHLDRGYERLTEKLSRCGADIERMRLS